MTGRILSALLCAALLMLPTPARAAILFEDESPEAADDWTFPVPLAVLEDPQDVLRLINRENLLERDYPDQSIDMYAMVPVSAPTTGGGMTLRPVANDALLDLAEAAAADGYSLYVDSAYRTYRQQEVSHYNRVERLGRDDGLVMPAGASEHQAGLAADVASWAYRDGLKQSFGDTPEGIWLRENCARFGFILRYPRDKEDITGVGYEPWHLRYVGPEAAAYITEAGLSLEEFTREAQWARQQWRLRNAAQ